MSWTWRKPRVFVEPALTRPATNPQRDELAELRVELAKRTGERDMALAQVAIKQATIGRLETTNRTLNTVLKREMERVQELLPFEDLAISRLDEIDRLRAELREWQRKWEAAS